MAADLPDIPSAAKAKPFSIHCQTMSHPRIKNFAAVGNTVWQFHTAYATQEERDTYFDLLTLSGGGMIRTRYMKVDPKSDS